MRGKGIDWFAVWLLLGLVMGAIAVTVVSVYVYAFYFKTWE